MIPLPAKFKELMQQWLGSEWPLLRDALDAAPTRGVRLHRVRAEGTDADSRHVPHAPTPEGSGWAADNEPLPLPHALRPHLTDPVPWMEGAYYTDKDARLGGTVWHEAGTYYIQEPSAMAVATAVDARPGEQILDLCAAPGGKSGALGRRLGTRGWLLANDIQHDRARILAQNMERLGVPATVVSEHPERLASLFPGVFDAVLVDAPCSGEGMFRKDPATRLRWSERHVEGCAERQRKLLETAIRMVRHGGRLVYSTCTFNPVENEQVVAWALATLPVELEPLPAWPGWEPGRPEWAGGRTELVCTRRLWPHRGRGEGHFIARFRVLNGERPRPPRMALAIASRTANEVRAALADEWIRGDTLSGWIEDGRVVQTGPDHLSWIPADALHPHGLRALRAGFPLAERRGKRWLPAHGLAMAVSCRAAARPLEISEAEALAWFAGEPLHPVGVPKGGLWLHLAGLPLGFGHAVGDRINNMYPKGLRRHDLKPLDT